MTPKLHCFAQSGNAYKVALTLDLCGEEWEPVFVDFFHGEARSPAYRQINEMAEVPTYTEGDLCLTQSGVILDYLAEKHGKFGPQNAEERREILRWLLWDNHKFTSQIATGRFLQLFLAEDKRNADVIAFLMGRFKAAMKVLEARLEPRPFILGDRPTIADFSCAGYIWFLGEVGLEPGPALARWRDAIAALPGWRHPYDAMPGHPLDLS
ncbi:glutathione S-transferase family protein [Algicella marina]|uniref:Glutathione S-transferase n=1 Tax=Algicella marina TaxID=2683284 RepID=A0A6P1T1D1_9RHOB|nr:glutathione S-transferase family protein [Algicella marina]QHQ35551.1 glutathione S-transferase [Algicella marina]